MKTDGMRKVSPFTAKRMCCTHTSVVSVPISMAACGLWELTGTTQGAWCSCIEVTTRSNLNILMTIVLLLFQYKQFPVLSLHFFLPGDAVRNAIYGRSSPCPGEHFPDNNCSQRVEGNLAFLSFCKDQAGEDLPSLFIADQLFVGKY